MMLHDVSVLISEKLPTWPGDPGISLKLTSSLARGDNANVTLIEMGAHVGTHIDAPFHFEPDGKTIDQPSIAFSSKRTLDSCFRCSPYPQGG